MSSELNPCQVNLTHSLGVMKHFQAAKQERHSDDFEVKDPRHSEINFCQKGVYLYCRTRHVLKEISSMEVLNLRRQNTDFLDFMEL